MEKVSLDKVSETELFSSILKMMKTNVYMSARHFSKIWKLPSLDNRPDSSPWVKSINYELIDFDFEQLKSAVWNLTENKNITSLYSEMEPDLQKDFIFFIWSGYRTYCFERFLILIEALETKSQKELFFKVIQTIMGSLRNYNKRPINLDFFPALYLLNFVEGVFLKISEKENWPDNSDVFGIVSLTEKIFEIKIADDIFVHYDPEIFISDFILLFDAKKLGIEHLSKDSIKAILRS